MRVKVYVVQPANPETGEPVGPPVSAKLTREAAQKRAKAHAPARVTPLYVDKDGDHD